jgi:predicted dehydrogenase
MTPVRIGVIGTGQIGKAHLQRYAEMPGAKIVAAADISQAALREAAAQFGIPHTCTDYRELLARDDIEAVDVCLHNRLHAPVTIAALEAGKHVYCEKPIAGSYAEGRRMVEAAAATGRLLQIQLRTLFSMETKSALRLIRDGCLGRLYHARSTGFRRRGRPFVDGYGTAQFVKKEVAAGGALYDMGIYHIAQMLHLLGMPAPRRIAGKTYQEMDMHAERRRSSGYDVEEFAVGLVRFDDGVTLDIAEAWAVNLDGFEGSYVLGAQGGVRLNPFGFFTTVADMDLNAGIDLKGTDTRWHRLDPGYTAYDSPEHHWLAALRGQVALLPTAQLALQTMLIQEGIYLSDRLGREVAAEEVIAASTEGTPI